MNMQAADMIITRRWITGFWVLWTLNYVLAIIVYVYMYMDIVKEVLR